MADSSMEDTRVSPVACPVTLSQLKDFLSLLRPCLHWGDGTADTAVYLGEVWQ